MKPLALLLLSLVLVPLTGAAQTPDPDPPATSTPLKREVRIPESALAPSKIHVAEAVTLWPHAVDPEVPEGLAVVRLLRQFSLEAGRSDLDREARGGLINTLQEKVRGNPAWHLLVVGLPDPVEFSDVDPELARSRAKTVAKFLESQGIAAKRISTMILETPPEVDETRYPLWSVIGGGVEVWAFAPASDPK